jgi:pyridoxamine 5'-phosphate oxidase
MVEKDLASLRNEYDKYALDIAVMPSDPIEAFGQWFSFAQEQQCREVNAMTLSTIDARLRPSSRVVLLKDFDERGFVFFTNYSSRKGKELAQNPYAALNFFWPELERQVRIEGITSRISEEESIAYFNSRPLLSKAGAIASNQSSEIPDRESLEKKMEQLLALKEEELVKPETWGGYLLVPDLLEFWQGRPGRLHDRICYTKENDIWRKFRLAP